MRNMENEDKNPSKSYALLYVTFESNKHSFLLYEYIFLLLFHRADIALHNNQHSKLYIIRL